MKNQSSQTRNGRRYPVPAAASQPGAYGGAINATKLALLITYLAIVVKGEKHYCLPHPDTTIALLQKFHGIEIGRRWFFQCMLDLEVAGFMRRQRRWIQHPDPRIESDSSLWWFTIRGARFMCSKMIRGSQQLLHSMLNWINRGDDRRPTAKDLSDSGQGTDQSDALKRIRQIIKDIG